AEHVIDVAGTDAGTGQGATDGGVAGGDIRIGAVVDVQQRSLRALVQDVAALGAQVTQHRGDVVDHRANEFARRQRVVQDPLVIDRVDLQPVLEDEVVVVDGRTHLLRQLVRVHQV